jgi:sec-independent protein translocase protein TatC
MIKVDEYFGFVLTLVLAMGAVFELPIVILLLTAMGLVNPRFLSKFRRHAIVGSYVAASIITPGDLVYTSVILTIPLYLLYEMSIGLSWIVYRKRERKRLAEEAAEAAA